jgi:hypothetical protein
MGIRTGVLVVGSVLAIVFLPIILGLGRLASVPANAASRLMQRNDAGVPDFDADGNPRRKRRVAPFWLAFGGFYTVLALIIATVWFGSAAGSSPPSAGSSASGHPGFIAGLLVSPSQSASPSTSPTASPTATPAPTPTKAPTPKPTKKPTPKPTKKPTPKPTPVPTPKLTASPASGPVHGTLVTFTVTWTVGSSCKVTRTYVSGPALPPPGPTTYTVAIGSAGTGTFQTHGNTAGTYSFVAVCGTSTSAAFPFTWHA